MSGVFYYSVVIVFVIGLTTVCGSVKLRTCKSMDIRNSVKNLEQNLRGCQVIEGFLYVVLIDHANESDFDSISFPELREITGYLLIYRVVGLRSIGQLFPNLTVIRGNVLFMDYALVIYEMGQLQEVGLQSLTTIVRGSVWIVRNQNLCYVDTVDWEAIASKGITPYISDNKRPQLCPRCDTARCDKNCWNSTSCQVYERTNCHELCLGGCTGKTSNDCFVCNGVLTIDNRCVHTCPIGTYKFNNRRCISAEDCQKETVQNLMSDFDDKGYWIFNGSCVHECPAGYEKGINGSSCVKCHGRCRKECMGASISTIADAEILRGCTYINGSLEISITGQFDSKEEAQEEEAEEISIRSGKLKIIQQELEDGLNSIEEIGGYLKIARCFPLTSLNFLKNLRVIHGTELDNKNNALVILENKNLLELWDWNLRPNGSTISILNGSVFFHYNPKLCMSHISNFIGKLNYTNKTSIDISRESNGDKYACISVNLTVRVSKRHNQSIIIVIDRPKNMSLEPYLLRYIVFYVESPEQNMTFDEPDECGDYGWKTNDVLVTGDADENKFTNGSIYHPITRLQPDTQYAFYVKTYTVNQEGGQSDLQYARTLPSKPTFPIEVKGYSDSNSEITLNWLPPLKPNGKLEKYVIIGFRQNVDRDFLLQRNFCLIPMIFSHEVTTTTIAPDTLNKTEEIDCECQEKKVSQKGNNGLQLLCENNLENEHRLLFSANDLHNCEKYVYSYLHDIAVNSKQDNFGFVVPGINDEEDDFPIMFADKFPKIEKKDELVRDTLGPYYYDKDHNEMDEYGKIKHFVRHSNMTSIKINALDHYTEYSFEILACRKIDPEEPLISRKLINRCSDAALITVRTLKKEDADIINPSLISHNVNNKTIEISWSPPSNPNGIIVNYIIEYRRTDISNSNHATDCITPGDYESYQNKGYNHKIEDLLPGKYAFRIKAISMANEGNFTKLIYFEIKEDFVISAEIIITFLIIIILTAIFIIGVTIYWRNKYQPPDLKLIASVNPEYSSVKYVEDEWEMPRDNVKILNELGQGTFGMVYHGLLKPNNANCAVKTVNESATEHDYYEFLNEASIMKSFYEAYHIVKLLGVVSKGTPPLVIMELMSLGDLKSYLRAARENCDHPPPSHKIVLLMAAQIADGMAYLEARKFVHRDLAARNCMVSDNLTVKIGDFGMTRDIYETDYYRKGDKGLLPIRWMAPESLKDGVFTSQSDVWSYGVVLWEMATLAEQPYQGYANEQVLQFVIDGNTLDLPLFSPQALKPIMVACWKRKPQQRPTFFQIINQLECHTNEQFKLVSYYHSDESTEARQWLKHNKPEQKFSLFPKSLNRELRLNPPVSTSSNTPGTSGSGKRISFQNKPNTFPGVPTTSNCKISNGQALFNK